MDFLSNMMEKICLLKMKGTKSLIVAPVVCSEYLDKFKDDGFIEVLP